MSPLFDLVCEQCQVTHEVLIPLDELNNEIKCPDCGGILKRMIGTPAFKIN